MAYKIRRKRRADLFTIAYVFPESEIILFIFDLLPPGVAEDTIRSLLMNNIFFHERYKDIVYFIRENNIRNIDEYNREMNRRCENIFRKVHRRMVHSKHI